MLPVEQGEWDLNTRHSDTKKNTIKVKWRGDMVKRKCWLLSNFLVAGRGMASSLLSTGGKDVG